MQQKHFVCKNVLGLLSLKIPFLYKYVFMFTRNTYTDNVRYVVFRQCIARYL